MIFGGRREEDFFFTLKMKLALALFAFFALGGQSHARNLVMTHSFGVGDVVEKGGQVLPFAPARVTAARVVRSRRTAV